MHTFFLDICGKLAYFADNIIIFLRALCKVKFLLKFKHRLFAALDAVAHALSCNVFMLCNFGERQILVIIKINDIALFIGEHICVIIKQNRKL